MGYDKNVRVWDLENGVEKYCIAGSQKENPTDVAWKDAGDLIGSTWKDKMYRIVDPRAGSVVH